jgi:hypothetical protein
MKYSVNKIVFQAAVDRFRKFDRDSSAKLDDLFTEKRLALAPAKRPLTMMFSKRPDPFNFSRLEITSFIKAANATNLDQQASDIILLTPLEQAQQGRQLKSTKIADAA